MSGEHRVFVLRHGQTEWSQAGRHTGITDVPLTAQGEREAVAAGRLLARLGPDPVLVLTSPRSRARRTAELAGVGPAEVVDDLQEWDYGDYEGVTTPQIRERVPGWTVWTHPCPGGENAEQVQRRADRVLHRCRPALDVGDVLLVGHGHIGRVVVARWIELPAAAGVRVRLDTAAVTVLGHERGVPQLAHVNLTPVD